jgi:hypothetical protein
MVCEYAAWKAHAPCAIYLVYMDLFFCAHVTFMYPQHYFEDYPFDADWLMSAHSPYLRTSALRLQCNHIEVTTRTLAAYTLHPSRAMHTSSN